MKKIVIITEDGEEFEDDDDEEFKTDAELEEEDRKDEAYERFYNRLMEYT